MTSPKVTVVVPTYNGSRYIRKALASLQEQTMGSWEAIVVDDGSTDSTVSIVREFMASEPRIRLIQHLHNRKLPTALNTGFSEARGNYLTWTADDNLFRPRALEVLMRYLEEHPDVGLVYSAATVIDEAGVTIRFRPAADPHDLYERNPVGWCFMYPAWVRTEIGGYDPAFFLAEDIEYWLRISMRYVVAAIPDDLYLYRAHAGSLTESRKLDCRRAYAMVQLRHIAKLPWASREEKARVLYELMSFFLTEARRTLGLRACLQGAVQSPRYFFRRFREKQRLARG